MNSTYIPNETNILSKLRDLIELCFSIHQLQELCFEVRMPAGDLTGKTLNEKIISLVENTKQRGKLSELVKLCKQLRPQVRWPDVSSFAPPLPAQVTKRIPGPDARLQEILQQYYPQVWMAIMDRGLFEQ